MLRKKKSEIADKEAVVTAMDQTKAYSIQMLGGGRKNGGTKEHRQNRYDVLERVRLSCGLTKHQEGQWEFLKLLGTKICQRNTLKSGANTSAE